MSNFDVLIVSGNRTSRGITQGFVDLIAYDDPNADKSGIKIAANPAQAQTYFTEHRNEARNLLVIADEDMSKFGYRGTSYEIPKFVPIEEQNFQSLNQRAKQWCKDTGSHCFMVHRSDAQSTPIDSIGQIELNNFDNCVEVSKSEKPFDQFGYFGAILNHCDKLFATAQP